MSVYCSQINLITVIYVKTTHILVTFATIINETKVLIDSALNEFGLRWVIYSDEALLNDIN